METSLEKELREWRENRSRAHAAIVTERHHPTLPSYSASSSNRRVLVNGQQVVVVSKARRPLA